MSDCRFGVSPVNYPDPDPEGIFLHVALSAKLTRTCYLFISIEFNGSFHWLKVRRISHVMKKP